MSNPARFWMVKQEPTSYAWSAFVADGRAAWTGVRNYQARNNLRAMRKGDLVFYYHSVVGKEVVGVAKVTAEAYPDPTAKEGDWSCVDLAPVRALPAPVTLEQIKANAKLRDIGLVRLSRLSVIPLTQGEFHEIERMAGEGTPQSRTPLKRPAKK
jgi:predicted RNA-binding protein with PUA-like domain